MLIALCLVGTGVQWDLLQAIAWVRMTMAYSQTMPLSSAVRETLDGRMCPLCQMVARAHKQEAQRSGVPNAKADTKLVLFLQEAEVAVLPPSEPARWPAAVPQRMAVGRSAPPVPPPRAAAV